VFGKTLVFIIKEFAGPVRELVRAVLRGDRQAKKEAMIRLDTAAEEKLVEKARGG
jgi:hypothetical protein